MRAILLTLFVLLTALAGCTEGNSGADDEDHAVDGMDHDGMDGDGMDSGSGDGMMGPTTHRIDIKSFAFSDADLDIHVGDTVIWTNQDSAMHTVDSTDGGPLDSGNLAQDDTYTVTFDEAGTFSYRCDIHTNMMGSITVS